MEELFEKLKLYIGDDYCKDDDKFLQLLLDDALEEVCGILYPYGFSSEKEKDEIRGLAISKYSGKIRKIAQYHFDKHGKDGTLSWSENGASSSYESAGTPNSYLTGIIPVAKIV